MITPAAINKKEFTRGVRGYKEEEVDQFLDLIAADLSKLIRENEAYKERIKELMKEVERYSRSETAILGTLESAKALMTEISASAEKRAEIALKNAEIDAERIRQDARDSVEHITEEAVALSRRWELFSARFRNLLETELDRFNSFSVSTLLDEPSVKPAGRSKTINVSSSSPMPMPTGSDKTFKTPRQ